LILIFKNYRNKRQIKHLIGQQQGVEYPFAIYTQKDTKFTGLYFKAEEEAIKTICDQYLNSNSSEQFYFINIAKNKILDKRDFLNYYHYDSRLDNQILTAVVTPICAFCLLKIIHICGTIYSPDLFFIKVLTANWQAVTPIETLILAISITRTLIFK